MPRAKSVVVSMELTTAGNSHNCKFNKSHRIERHARRLTINEDGTLLNYCLPCARAFLAKGAARIAEMQTEVENLLGATPLQ